LTLLLAYVIAYNTCMKTTSYSDLRRNLAATIDKVTADHEPIVITRDRGKPAAVLISVEDFASYEETRYLLQSPSNAARLLDATHDLDRGQGVERELSD
jgi:antitoxin YefM